MRKKTMIVFISVVVLLLTAACGNEGEKGTISPSPIAEEIDTGPAEVVIYSSSATSEEAFNEGFGAELRKKFPHYTIKLLVAGKGTTLSEVVAAGTRFDILYANLPTYLKEMTEYDLGYDLTDLIKKHKVELSSIEPTMLDVMTSSTGGKLYALPVYNNSLVMFYNKGIFNKFGVPLPKDGMTWDETLEIAKKLTREDSGKAYYGFTQLPTHTIRLNPLSIPLVDLNTNTPTINKDERWKQLIQTIYFDPSQLPVYRDYMTNKKKAPGNVDFATDQNVAMFAYLGGFAGTSSSTKGLDWDMVALPTFKDKPKVGSQVAPVYFGITKQAQNKDAAMQVLKYLVSPEMQAIRARNGSVPVLKDKTVQAEFGKDTTYNDKNLKALFYNEYAQTPANATYNADLELVYATYAGKIQRGEVDMNTGLRQAEEEAAKIIANNQNNKIK